MSEQNDTIIIGVGKIGVQIAEKLSGEGITPGIRRFDAIAIYPEAQKGGSEGLDLFEWPESKQAKEIMTSQLQTRIKNASCAIITTNLGMDSASNTLREIAQAIRGALESVVCIGIEPYSYEGETRVKGAEVALRALSSSVDMLGTISRNNLVQILPPQTTLPQANDAISEIAALASTATALMLGKSRNLASIFGFPAMDSPMAAAMSRGEDAPAEAIRLAAEKSLLTRKVFDASKGVFVMLIIGRTPTIGDMQNIETTIKNNLAPGASHKIEVIEDLSLGKSALASIAAIPALGVTDANSFPSEDPETLAIPAFIRRRGLGRGRIDRRMGRRSSWR